MNRRAGIAIVFAALSLFAAGSGVLFGSGAPRCFGDALASPAAGLGTYNVDIRQTSVSGVSSGGYMAGQLHVAYSDSMVGVGLIAAGPYYCSQGSIATALSECWLGGIPTVDSAKAIRTEAAKGSIDDPANLSNDKVYLFTGSKDSKVGNAVVDAAYRQYQQFVPESNILYQRDTYPAGHSMVTQDYGNACSAETGEYINDCDFDLAGELLKHIYGPLNGPAQRRGAILAFKQSDFIDDPAGAGMNETGFAYIPSSCVAGKPCRVHVVFHGCKQSVIDIGDSYYTKTGYNEWGEANHIIMLYPQTSDCCNRYSCWDWMGYTDAKFHTKDGQQVKAVMNMVKRLAGQPFERAKASKSCWDLYFFKFCS